MTTAYTPNLGLAKPAHGDNIDTWDVPMNADWDIVDTTLGGVTTLNVVAVSGTVTLTSTQYRPRIIILSGLLTANITYQFPAGVGGTWSVYNNTTGAFTVTFASATGGGATTVATQGYSTAIVCDGTNVRKFVTQPNTAAGSTTQIQYNNAGLLAGSSTFVYSALGDVGIGTASPINYGAGYTAVHAYGTNGGVFHSQGGAVTGDFYADTAGTVNIRSVGAYPLVFYTNSIERMRMLANGRLGIGTLTPATEVEVVGTITATDFSGPLTGNADTATNAANSTTQAATDNSTKIATTAFVKATTIGATQTWQDVSGSRSSGVTYTNTTGAPIMVLLSCPDTISSTAIVSATVGGLLLFSVTYDSGASIGALVPSFIVPPGATYTVTWSGFTPTWCELF